MNGDKLFDFLVVFTASLWVLGWVILLVVTIIQKVNPKLDAKTEQFLQNSMKFIALIQKYSLIMIIFLFCVRLLAGWFGWAKPLM
jgi:hypothetical protein